MVQKTRSKGAVGVARMTQYIGYKKQGNITIIIMRHSLTHVVTVSE
jgi:hypothetical protein